MITDVEYMQIVNEVYDLSDYATKKKVLFCNEAGKMENIEHIVGKLYDHIKGNITGIDFGTIPRSNGVITKVENYSQLVDCITVIHDLVMNYGEDTKLIDEVSTLISNIQNRERSFSKAFALNIEMPMMLYNTAVLAAVSSVSLLITSSIEYIKNGHDSYSMSFDKVGYNKSKDHVLYEYICQFNRNCKNGTIDKLINECIKNNVTATNESTEVLEEANAKDLLKFAASTALSAASLKTASNNTFSGVMKGFSGTKVGKVARIVLIIIGIGSALWSLLHLIRQGTYYWLRMKVSLSNWFSVQAELLQMNAENLKYRSDDEEKTKKVYQNQMQKVEKFKKIANALALKDKKAQKEADDDDKDYSRKRKYEDDNDDNNSDDGGLF